MKQFAIIQNSKVAYEDHANTDRWWFDTFLADSCAAMQIRPLDALYEAMFEYDALSPKELNGRFCVVEVDDGLIRYVGPVK